MLEITIVIDVKKDLTLKYNEYFQLLNSAVLTGSTAEHPRPARVHPDEWPDADGAVRYGSEHSNGFLVAEPAKHDLRPAKYDDSPAADDDGLEQSDSGISNCKR